MDNLMIFSGSSHVDFAEKVAAYCGVPLGAREITQFSNENLFPKFNEPVVDKDVFVIQTQSKQVHMHLFELFIMMDILKYAPAKRITAVFPYMPYVRSDKEDQSGISITARMMADLITHCGGNRALFMDLHSHQVKGFFRIPVDHLFVKPVFLHDLLKEDVSNCVAVAADAGEGKHIGPFGEQLKIPLAIVDKRRTGNDEKPKPVNLVGSVDGKIAIVFDDEIASGATLVEAADFLCERGAKEVWAYITHGVLSGKAVEKLAASSAITRLVITDTIPLPDSKKLPKIRQISVAHVFGEAIKLIHVGKPIQPLLDLETYREIFSRRGCL